MVSITFLNTEFLWLLFTIPLIIALHFFMLKYTKRKAVLFANFEALRRVTGSVVFSKNITLLIVRILVIIFLTFSAAGITFWTTGIGSDFNYAIAIDASSSMLAQDLSPNRLQVAKETAILFVNSNTADVKTSVVSFAGVPRIEKQLTDSKSSIEDAIQSIQISGVGGTDITSAITTAVNSLIVESDKSNSIILLTDGQHTVGGPIEEGIKYANEKKIIVHTIGIATEKGGAFELTNLISTIDESSLERIAHNTGGKYYKVGSRQQLEGAFNELLSISEQNQPHKLRLLLLIIGLVLLFLEWVLLNTRFRTLP